MSQRDGRRYSRAYDHDANEGYRNREQRRHDGSWWFWQDREPLRVKPRSDHPKQTRAARKLNKPGRSRKPRSKRPPRTNSED